VHGIEGLVCRKKRRDTHIVFEFVMANQAFYPVHSLCRVLGVLIGHPRCEPWITLG
jgi:hypothetical protein